MDGLALDWALLLTGTQVLPEEGARVAEVGLEAVVVVVVEQVLPLEAEVVLVAAVVLLKEHVADMQA